MMDSSTEFTRLGFKNFKKLFDLSVLQKQQTNDSVFSKNFKMLSARQLSRNIDSLRIVEKEMDKNTFNQFKFQLRYSNIADSIWKKKDSSTNKIAYKNLIPDLYNVRIKQYALNKATEIKTTLQQNSIDREMKGKELIYHEIEWHRKYSISMACLILFFIGAPLGAIIRKGGLGMPLVIAIIFFLIFHLLNMFGEKFVKESFMIPSIGMWLAIIALAPVGIFLTYKAMNDSQLFNPEYYIRFFKRTKSLLFGKKK